MKRNLTLQGTNISPLKVVAGKMIVLFHRWDMLVPRRVSFKVFGQPAGRLHLPAEHRRYRWDGFGHISWKTTSKSYTAVDGGSNILYVHPSRWGFQKIILPNSTCFDPQLLDSWWKIEGTICSTTCSHHPSFYWVPYVSIFNKLCVVKFDWNLPTKLKISQFQWCFLRCCAP